MPPETLGAYRVRGPLGEGAFGAVYDAEHQESGQRAAVKLLHAATALEPEVQNRFVREIAILQRLDHENIVRHYDCGLHEGSIYCAMELIDRGTVRDLIRGGRRLPWREAAKIAKQVARGLSHAHEQGCVHRDLKPANLYVSQEGQVKIGDLGLARDLDSSRLTAEGHTVGTWRYMAPEQIMGRGDIDGRLDLYALGCILFRMIVGRVPFDGADFAEIFDQHLETPPERVDALVSDVPPELADLIDWMLKKQPDERPPDAKTVADQLDRLLTDMPSQTIAESPEPAITDSGLEGETTKVYSPLHTKAIEPQTDRSPAKWWVWLILGGVLAVILLLAFR